MLACFSGHEAVVRRLREVGAEWNCTDRGGSTALHWAVDGGNCHLIEWMINDGAPVIYHFLFKTDIIITMGQCRWIFMTRHLNGPH